MVCLNALGNSLSGIFVNVYLLKLTQNFFEVSLFNFVAYAAWLPSFVVAGWLSKMIDRKRGLIIGGAFQIFFYFLILVFGHQSKDWIVPLGIVFGIGSGFYWLAVNVLSVDFTTSSNRDWFNGVNGIFGSFSQMVGPVAAGLLITLMPEWQGYKTIFVVSFILFVLSMAMAVKLPVTMKDSRYSWSMMFNLNRLPEWRRLVWSFVGIAFRDGVLTFAVWLWVYASTKNEGVLGNFASATTTLSIITFFLLGRFGKPEKRGIYLVFGTLLLSLSLLVLVYETTWIFLLVYGVVAAVSRPLIEVPFTTITQNTIASLDESGRYTVEFVVSREIALSIGRITSVGALAILYSLANAGEMLKWFLVVLILAGMAPLFFVGPTSGRGKQVECKP
ncbi:YQGE family putative transporter [Effusibacillus lacus]|nr:YQGE family putative transporter [Effusibacillus lacus]